jgi:hypothetical protein
MRINVIVFSVDDITLVPSSANTSNGTSAIIGIGISIGIGIIIP